VKPWLGEDNHERGAKDARRALSDVERTGESVTIADDGPPIGELVPVSHHPHRFGQLPVLKVTDAFDDPLVNNL